MLPTPTDAQHRVSSRGDDHGGIMGLNPGKTMVAIIEERILDTHAIRRPPSV